MENFQEEESKPGSLAEQVRDQERKLKHLKRDLETTKRTKQFKWPGKWKRKFKQSTKKKMNEMMLVFYLNKKNEMEMPKFMPIYDGNMIIWKHKPYEFDPRAVWRVKGMKKTPQAYLIKEIDRRPVMNKNGKYIYGDAAVTNMDIEEVRARGDSTESDAFLIKAALNAKIKEGKKAANVAVIVVIGLLVVGGLIWLLAS